MKLVDFLATINDWHFGLRLADEKRYRVVDYTHCEYDNYEVINVRAVARAEAPKPPIYSINVTPLILVTIKEHFL